MEEELKAALKQAINLYYSNQSELLKQAFASGGNAAVEKMSREQDALRDAYFDLLKKQLDKHNPQYDSLISQTGVEAEKLQSSLTELNNIGEVIRLLSSVVQLVGNLIIVLGV